MIYGYARCSTNEARQDIDRQKRELFKMGVESPQHIYWEYESGRRADRPEFQKLMACVAPGDTIATTEVSRLTRSTSHLCEIMRTVEDKKLRLLIGAISVDCRSAEIDPMTKGMLMMWGVFAELERDIIAQRVRSGLANARAKGVKLGRPALSTADVPSQFWKYLPLYDRKEISLAKLAVLIGRSRPSVYRYLRLRGAS